MEAALIVMGILLAGALGAAGWLAATRGRLMERAVRAEAEAESAAANAGRVEGELRESLERERARAEASGTRVLELSEQLAQVREQLGNLTTIKQELEANEKRMREAFAKLSGEALKHSGESLLQLAEQRFGRQHKEGQAELEKRSKAIEELVKPIRETLGEAQKQLVTLSTRVEESKATGEKLRGETERLARALSRPEVRGRYGEIQLRRVAELAGMVNYCDFAEQTSVRDDDGRLKRPDMVVRLPNDRVVVVDAKCNIEPYVRAAEATEDGTREDHLERFAAGVETQIRSLAGKRYWSEYDGSPDFMVMFVPGDQFLDAALARRPELLERAAEQSVILASPSTLIGLLRAVAVGWREHRLAEEAQRLLELGRELHRRAATAFEHASALGRAIEKSVESYNKFVGSYQSQLEPTLRKFEAAGVKGAKELPEVGEVEVRARVVASPRAAMEDDQPQ